MKRWPIKPLGEVCAINPKLTASETPGTDTEVTFVPMAAVDEVSGSIARPELREYSQVAKGYTPFRENDVLFAKITPCMQNGKAAIARGLRGGLGFGSTEFHVLRPSSGLLPQWVFALIRRPSFRSAAAANFTGTAGQQRVPADFLKKFPIPVPPLAEQDRIVKLLDEADELRKLRAQADRRTAALLPALFHEMFGDPDWKNWKERTFGDAEVMEIIDGDRGANYPKKTDFRESGHCLFLNTSNVRKGAFDFLKCDFITREKDGALRKGKLTRGDVILTTRGTLGNSAHYDNAVVYENIRINSGMVILRANPALLLPEYLLVIINSDGFRSQVNTLTSGTAQPQLPINRLSHIKCVLPPLQLQKEFAQRVAEIREMESTQTASRLRLDSLFASMLDRAFKGEL